MTNREYSRIKPRTTTGALYYSGITATCEKFGIEQAGDDWDRRIAEAQATVDLDTHFDIMEALNAARKQAEAERDEARREAFREALAEFGAWQFPTEAAHLYRLWLKAKVDGRDA